MSITESYSAILEVLEDNASVLNKDSAIDIRSSIKRRILLQKISEEFGVEITNKDAQPEWIEVNGYTHICLMGEEHRRTISWPDDGRQPDNERLMSICFPTGSYIFGSVYNDNYPKETFIAFFNELADFGPEYKDTMNSCLYFSKEKAKAVNDAFWGIFEKYADIAKEEFRLKKINDLEENLKKLKGE